MNKIKVPEGKTREDYNVTINLLDILDETIGEIGFEHRKTGHKLNKQNERLQTALRNNPDFLLGIYKSLDILVKQAVMQDLLHDMLEKQLYASVKYYQIEQESPEEFAQFMRECKSSESKEMQAAFGRQMLEIGKAGSDILESIGKLDETAKELEGRDDNVLTAEDLQEIQEFAQSLIRDLLGDDE